MSKRFQQDPCIENDLGLFYQLPLELQDMVADEVSKRWTRQEASAQIPQIRSVSRGFYALFKKQLCKHIVIRDSEHLLEFADENSNFPKHLVRSVHLPVWIDAKSWCKVVDLETTKQGSQGLFPHMHTLSAGPAWSRALHDLSDQRAHPEATFSQHEKVSDEVYTSLHALRCLHQTGPHLRLMLQENGDDKGNSKLVLQSLYILQASWKIPTMSVFTSLLGACSGPRAGNFFAEPCVVTQVQPSSGDWADPTNIEDYPWMKQRMAYISEDDNGRTLKSCSVFPGATQEDLRSMSQAQVEHWKKLSIPPGITAYKAEFFCPMYKSKDQEQTDLSTSDSNRHVPFDLQFGTVTHYDWTRLSCPEGTQWCWDTAEYTVPS